VAIEVERNGEMHCQIYRVYMLTYTTDFANKGFCIMAASAAAHGFRLNVLGEGRQKEFDVHSYLDKLWSLKEFVDNIVNRSDRKSLKHSLLFFVDAYDVLITGSPLSLVKKTLLSGKKILFSSEKGCCSSREQIAYKNPRCDRQWFAPEYQTGSPYLNSGAWVAFIPQLFHMLEAAVDEWTGYRAKLEREVGPIQNIQQMPPQNKGPWDPYLVGGDQMLVCHIIAHYVFPEGHRYEGQGARKSLKMGIDYNAKVFLSAYKMVVGREVGFTPKKRVVYNGKLAQCEHAHHTGLDEMCRKWSASKPPATYPVVVHFNGKGPPVCVTLAT